YARWEHGLGFLQSPKQESDSRLGVRRQIILHRARFENQKLLTIGAPPRPVLFGVEFAIVMLAIGTGIALLPQRDTIITAKSVASLDQLSGGRFIFAIGGGWNVEEMENHGVRYESRFKLLRERVLAMKTLWTQPQAEFHGEFVNFD